MPPTLRQIAAVKALAENGRNKGDALRKAGYSESIAKRPTDVLNSKGFKEASKEFVAKMRKERDRIIQAMSERNLKTVDYQKLTTAVDTLTKNIQLLNGDDTERTSVKIDGIEMITPKK